MTTSYSGGSFIDTSNSSPSHHNVLARTFTCSQATPLDDVNPESAPILGREVSF